ncbi:MAG: hypothetical protein IKY44_03340, partial [Clostridia bacterium]|nr:hypothetical protein [Clostridia bacterium]
MSKKKKDKTVIDEIMDEIRHTESEYDTTGIDTQLDPERQEVLDSVDAILAGRKSPIVADIEETTSRYTEPTDATTAVFDRLRNPAEDSPTMYFKRSRFQTKPISFEATGEITFDTPTERPTPQVETPLSEPTVVRTIAKENDEPVRSYRGQSVFDGRVNNQRERMDFSQQIPEPRRISRPGATGDIFTTSTITPTARLSDTSTDDLAKLFGAGRSESTGAGSDNSQVVEGQIRFSGFDD